MPHFIHQFAFYIHITVGSIALLAFWLPLLANKGSKNHRLFGKVFVNAMYTVAASGFVMSTLVLLDPMAVRLPEASMNAEKAASFMLQNRIFAGFLLMLSVLVFSNVRQSILVLKAKADRSRLKTSGHIGLLLLLAGLALVMGAVGFYFQILLFKLFAGLCIANSTSMLYYIFKANIKPREWILVHLGNIFGAGIGSYTAFFAFGGRRLFGEFLTGHVAIVPWVLPSIIGVSAMIYLTRKYRSQYRVA